jgi:DNA-binding NarL/FixJ family response regulator
VNTTTTCNPRRILLIDDSPVFIRGVRDFLGGRDGLAVESAGTATLGLQLAGRMHPDLVLLDYSLPDMNGIECARQLRSGGSRASIVLVSGHELGPLEDLARHAGVDGLIGKWRFAAAIGSWL